MSEKFSKEDMSEFDEWRSKIEVANRKNIFFHCRMCSNQWVVFSHRGVGALAKR